MLIFILIAKYIFIMNYACCILNYYKCNFIAINQHKKFSRVLLLCRRIDKSVFIGIKKWHWIRITVERRNVRNKNYLTLGGPIIIPVQCVRVMSSSFSRPQLMVPSPTPFCPCSSSSSRRKFRGTTETYHGDLHRDRSNDVHVRARYRLWLEAGTLSMVNLSRGTFRGWEHA